MEVAGIGGCSIRDLPPSKRFKYASSYSGLSPCALLPAKKRAFPPPPEAAAVPACLPAKKRVYAPPAAEDSAPLCLPVKKRVYATPVDASAPACLPAKKRARAPPPSDGDAYAGVPSEKRMPLPADAHASAGVPTNKRAHALPPRPPRPAGVSGSPFIPAKKRVYAALLPDASASTPVSLASNKRVLPPFIPPCPPPPTKADGGAAAAAGDSKVKESNKVPTAIRSKASKVVADPKEAKRPVSALNNGNEAIKQGERKRYEGMAYDAVREEGDGDLKRPKPQVEAPNKEDEAIEQGRSDGTEEAAQGAAEEEDDGVHCAVCWSTDGDPSDPIVFCDGCDLMVHASCYGHPLAQSIPDGDWFCSLCSAAAAAAARKKTGKPPPPRRPPCRLCPARGGAMKRTTEGQWAHIACALLVPEVFFRDPDGRDGVDCSRVPARRFTTECYICESTSGCALLCSQPKCGLGFHVSCGLAGGLCMEYREAKGGAVVAGFCNDHTKLWEKQQLTGKYKIVSRGQE